FSLARDREDVHEHRAPGAAPPQRLRRAHRLHLAVAARKLLQRAATEQLAVLPYRPERDAGTLQLRDVERMHALGGRKLVQVAELRVQQREHFGAGEVVGLDFHGGFCAPVSNILSFMSRVEDPSTEDIRKRCLEKAEPVSAQILTRLQKDK